MNQTLLNRTEFKESVFKRDNHKCVICGKPAVDAHHIIDRSLFDDGGYYLDNGVSLCFEHHMLAEETEISCEFLRSHAKIKNILYPSDLSLNEFVMDYDKWGNPILKDGRRLKGYIFRNANVQKIIQSRLKDFDKPYDPIVDKYPRTYHFPFSPGTTSDDRIAKNTNILYKRPVIITEKLDGENTSISQYGLFARSRTAPTKNPWAQWLKPKWDSIKNDLKDFDLEICGENMYGEHSIIYSGLQEHFYVFGVRNMKHDVFLSWEETEYWAKMFDFVTVPILFRVDSSNWRVENKFRVQQPQTMEDIINDLMTHTSHLSNDMIFESPKEGVVARIQEEFPNDMFYNSVYKYVRAKHVKTDEHWSKNWRRAKLESEILNIGHDKLRELYSGHIEQGLLKL